MTQHNSIGTYIQTRKVVVLLRRKISPKVINFVKKSKFQTVIFGIILVTMNGRTYKKFKNIFIDVQIEGEGEINMA